MRRFSFLMAAFLFLLSAGCSKPEYGLTPPSSSTLDTLDYSTDTVNDLDGVFLEILEVTDEKVSFAFVNNSEHTVCAYGQQGLQIFLGGAWTSPFPKNPNSAPTPSSYFEALPGGRSDTNGLEESIYFEPYYDESGEMESGLYRVIKPVFLQTMLEDGTVKHSEWYYLAAEFTID